MAPMLDARKVDRRDLLSGRVRDSPHGVNRGDQGITQRSLPPKPGSLAFVQTQSQLVIWA
jgi:hypothetical protein